MSVRAADPTAKYRIGGDMLTCTACGHQDLDSQFIVTSGDADVWRHCPSCRAAGYKGRLFAATERGEA